MEKKHVVKLTPKERRRCIAIVSKGRNKAAVIRRAHILLKSDEGKTDREISELLYISEETVRRVRVRFCDEGLDEALLPHIETKLSPTGRFVYERRKADHAVLTFENLVLFKEKVVADTRIQFYKVEE